MWWLYRVADKSSARPGRKQARKHVRDVRDFNNIETRAVINFFPARQGAEGNSRHSVRKISLFPSSSGWELISTPVHNTLRYHALLWGGRVFIQRCHLRCPTRLKASNVLVSWCLLVVVVAVIVDWDGLPVCCDVYWFFHAWRHLRKGCWSLYVE